MLFISCYNCIRKYKNNNPLLILLKFVSKVGTMGKNRRIIEIPKEDHKEADKFRGKKIKVTIDELKL